MKIICQRKQLEQQLAIAHLAVPVRPTHPVLGNILVKADADTNRVTSIGFDLNLGITTTFNTNVIESGEVTIPSKLLTEIVSRLPEGEITLESQSDDSNLIDITSASGKFQLSGLPAEDFPGLPTSESSRTIELPVLALIDGLKVLFAASNDETKQILVGGNIAWYADSIKFAATDGHRIAVVSTAKDENPEFYEKLKTRLGSITIPAYVLSQLKTLLTAEHEMVKLQIDLNQLMFDLGDQKLYCRRLEGVYPVYTELIPIQFSREAVMNRKDLLQALKLVSILSKNDYVKATFDSESEQVAFAVDSQGLGSGVQIVPAKIRGENIEIGFNLKYIVSALSAINGTEVKMQFNEANHPVIFTPLGGLDMTVLIMPIQIRE